MISLQWKAYPAVTVIRTAHVPHRLDSLTLGLMPQCMVHKNKRGHCFDHRDRSRQNARIMTAACLESRVVKANVDCVLLVHHGCNRFEGHTKVDRLAIGNATLNAAGPVAGRIDLSA